MRNQEQELQRGRRAAVFIVAAMLLALVYMLGQLDFSGPVGDASTPPPPKEETVAAFRIAVQLPADDLYMLPDARVIARVLEHHGVKWVLYRIPLWTPTARRAEYGLEDLGRHAERISALRAAGVRVIAAPVYWNGSTLTSRPGSALSKEFFLTYRTLVTEMAVFANDCGAEALLLDGVFGDPSISAAEWLELLTALHTAYDGKVEIRIGSGCTPAIYMPHCDGAYISANNGSMAADVLSAPDAGRTPIYCIADDADSYTSGILPWQPQLREETPSLDGAKEMLRLAEAHPRCRGIVLSGSAVVATLLDTGSANPLSAALRDLRQRRLSQDLERVQQKLTTGEVKR
ncbi:MAG: hypothetical protein M5R41_02425 [Bacteroidia bacterium]|nr:hypothetical protein [Bacteroidia bacterium]